MKAGLLRGVLLLFAVVFLIAGCSKAEDHAGSSNSGNSTASPSAGNGATESNESATLEPSPPPGSGDGEESRGGGAGGQGGPEPQAGQLTAGEWNDTLDWSRWGNLLNSRKGDEYQRHWGYFRFNRLAVEVTSGQRPVVDARLVLKDQTDHAVWEARTDNHGRAFAYAWLFDDHNQSGGDDEFSVELYIGQDIVKRYENVSIPRKEILQIDVQQNVAMPESADVMLVIDTTGSMADELQYLAAELKDVINRVNEQTEQELSLRLSANFYRDLYDDYVVKPFPFTKDVDEAVRQIAAQEAEGGGDYPEAVDEALANALYEHEWSREARARLLLLVMDAPPHDDKRTMGKMRDLTIEAARMGVRIIPVASSGVDKHTEYLMRFLAAATGGTYVFLTDHSGIGNAHLEPDVGEYEVHLLNDLLVDLIVRYTEHR
ncbi:vWA domain-containing protein [Paenibacillus abyssi]|uniref:VWFA domain-containing protein n=1 Tax=Paenibacillus abyssi TaxID=1340531 RepID=A0A917CVH6_9BACL|nr:vWA domain-containing protein [Paenibacillus abyssi]GGF99629.1 hypothetical protein GCM10010916_16110 [Paenibacillus abyssi]